MRNKALGRKIAKTLRKRGYRKKAGATLILRPGGLYSMREGTGKFVTIENASTDELYIRFVGR